MAHWKMGVPSRKWGKKSGPQRRISQEGISDQWETDSTLRTVECSEEWDRVVLQSLEEEV